MNRLTLRTLTGLVTLLLFAAILVAVTGSGPGTRTLTATFERTTSLYSGAKVKVLGVPVGTVDSIKVEGTAVEVAISYRADVELPRDVHALIVPPSIIGDRFIQLAPAYDSGPTLPDGAHLDLAHTGVPLELDDTYAALDKLAVGLGPDGANSDGAVSRLIRATAANISGHGAAFNRTVRELAGAISTLAGSSEDINQTVANLSELTHTLAGKDAQIRTLVENLARVGGELNGQRDDISTAVTQLRAALREVARFTRTHREALTSTIAGARDVTETLARRTDQLSRLLELAPVGLTNLANIYLPTNWDPAKPWQSVPAGRTGSANLHAVLLDDLDTQLAFTLSALCVQLPPAQQVQLASFCGTLTSVGGNLGALLSKAIETQGTSLSDASSLTDLIGQLP